MDTTGGLDQTPRTRLIFMGCAPLTDGFRLIGFETWADPPAEEVEKVVRGLINRRQNALLVIDQALATSGVPILDQVRREGGHIVVTMVPPLESPESFHLPIDDRLATMLGVTQLA
jgi:vacuolar-type H+-ATPase subunit F/Vma7